MKNLNLVSVIIPAHNRSLPLLETLESVARQTYRTLEVLVIDDASEEDILAVFDSIDWPLSYTRHYIRSETNGGPGAAREIGRQAASGEFISYLDSDDLWEPQKIEIQIRKLLDNPSAGMCYCISKEFKTLPFDGKEEYRIRSEQTFSSFLPHMLYGRPWGTGACLWRRWATDQIGPWLPTRVWEDYEYDCRAGCHDIPVIFIPDVYCYYRRRERQSSWSHAEIVKYRLMQAPSVIAMAQDLEQFGKLADKRIGERMISLLYQIGLSLILNKEWNAGRKCLDQIVHLSTSPYFLRLWVSAISIISELLHTDLMARVARKLSYPIESV
jgi:glycosyltransferase involved in cell wall biosynthesis